MGKGFKKMMQQARLMSSQYEKSQEDLKNTQFTGSAGNNLVEVVLNGDKQMKSITIDPECLKDVEGLQDLIVAAHNQATDQINEKSQEQMGGLPFSL